MSSRSFRATRAPVAFVTLLSFTSTLLPLRVALASDREAAPESDPARGDEGHAPAASTGVAKPSDQAATDDVGTPSPARTTTTRPKTAVRSMLASSVTATASAAAEASTEVSSQSMALPQGAGKVQGMGESFGAQLSTGIGTYSVPFALPSARGAAQPSLTLTYASSGGSGVAGLGWNIGVPYIARQTDHGHPGYRDPVVGGTYTPAQDRFVYNGSELVPVGIVRGGSCAGALDGEIMPRWAEAYQYFRLRVESGFQRFFWSPDHRTWRIQDKTGISVELGVPLDGSLDPNALETSPDDPTQIFRWNAARQYDLNGSGNPGSDASPHPSNVIVYRYRSDGGIAYPSDIYDTPPAATGAAAPLEQYAHHTHIAWETRPDALASFRRGFGITQRLRLSGVDVTSKPFVGALASPRRAVRRYHLAYDKVSHVSLLTSIQVEGRCGDEATAAAEDGTALLPATSCARMPASTFEYTHVRKADGSAVAPDLPGYEGFDDTVRLLAGSPPFSIDDGQTNFYDLNSDGIADILSTNAAGNGGAHAAFLNAAQGTRDTFGAPLRMSVPDGGLDAYALGFKNANVVPLDFDGDGVLDLVHLPFLKAPTVYTPHVVGASASWQRRVPDVPVSLNPKIDFTGHNPQVRVADVDGDGLVDIVATLGDRVQTYLSLGRYEGGDGKLGSATVDASNQLVLSAEPIAACLPFSGSYARLGDADVRLADMNGDGLVDFVRIRSGDIRYWPGRGDGHFGLGTLGACKPGVVVDGAVIAMRGSPVPPTGVSLSLADVNGDGLADLVQIRATGASVWLNVDGTGFTDRHVTAPTVAATTASRVRMIDVNGSGTPDIVWGDAGNYRYVDLLGGARPWLLARVTNGLGATTDLEYATSTDEMLAAARSSSPWTSVVPMVLHVVKRVTTRDHLERIGRAAGAYVVEYAYRDPVYDGVQREFRGFRSATETHVGDTNSPTSIVESSFLLGECVGECGPATRFVDNGREALKGLPRVVETFDAHGVALATHHSTYRVRTLYAGLDGRAVTAVSPSRGDTYKYDAPAFDFAAASADLVDVEMEPSIGVITPDAPTRMPLRSTSGRVRVADATVVDAFGNMTDTITYGCIEGCPAVDEIITAHATASLPEGDGTGWLWRTTERWTVGSKHPADVREHSFIGFDERGRARSSRGELRGSAPLLRAHAVAGAAIAPAPAHASQDGVVDFGATEYDDVGNIVRSHGPEGCTSVDYDATYRDFAVVATTYAGIAGEDGCGTRLLVTTAEYDRGFESPRATSGYNGERARIELDAFGRVAQSFAPHPTLLGETLASPSASYDYDLPSDPTARPYVVVHTRRLDGGTPEAPTYSDSYAYTDALGRGLVSLRPGDRTAAGGGDWIASGRTDFDTKGSAARRYLAEFYTGDPAAYPLGAPATAPYARQSYDAFGRVVDAYAEDGSPRLHTTYHALSEDAWDAEDLGTGPHAGTYRTVAGDGHGRTVLQTERFHDGGRLDAIEQHTEYLPTGEPLSITRVHAGSGDPPVVRWFRYDTLGRRVLNVESDTTKDFVADPAANADGLRTWRYAYDDGGRLVGTSDARGCGENYFYDAAGRVVAEDFSPCAAEQTLYSAPNLETGDGTEAFYRYDLADLDDDAVVAAGCSGAGANRGRVVSVASRGSKTVSTYDARGRGICTARKITRPGAPETSLATRYAPRWYAQKTTFDASDRLVASSTGARSPELLGGDGTSQVTFAYARSGAVATVDSSYGVLLRDVVNGVRGEPVALTYGDAASTTTAFLYDARHRLQNVQTTRARAPMWTTPDASYAPPADPTTSLQLILEDGEIGYDDADNPTSLVDRRIASEWPRGAKPVSRAIRYDDFYRVANVEYVYGDHDDGYVSPFEAEDHAIAHDDTRARPSPHVGFDTRIHSESYAYDWLGNTKTSSDDSQAFYDRSLGVITNGTALAGPYQLRAASNRATATARAGDLAATYDDAGNLSALVVHRDGVCEPAGSVCIQRFAYVWDETGRLAGARRWDLTPSEQQIFGDTNAAPPSRTPDAELHYAYTSAGERVLKSAVDGNGHSAHTAYVFDSLDVRRAAWIDEASDYQVDARTEVPYLIAGGRRLGRVVFADVDAPSATSGRQHVFLELPDHLGSTSIVLDKATGELVERATYSAFGGAESDYRPERWKSFREDYRFTGKEDDIEIGLQYFGKRYFSPSLNRWASPDPMAIHKLAADSNVYAYVHGRTFASVDPNGECELVCIMIIGALIGAAISMGTQYYATGSLAEIDMGAVGIAALAGAVGGGFGVAAAPLGAALGTAIGVGEGIGTATIAGGVGGIGAGMASRGAGTVLIGGGDAVDAAEAALNPIDISKDFAIGAVSGVVVYGAGKGLEAGYGAIKRAVSSGAGDGAGAGAGSTTSTAKPGGGGPSGEPLVADEPVNAAPKIEEEPSATKAEDKPTSPQKTTAKPKAPPNAARPPRVEKPVTLEDMAKKMSDLHRYIDHTVEEMPAEFDMTNGKLQHEFKHAGDFGVTSKWNASTAKSFADAIFRHVQDGNTIAVEGTFRWQTNVVHYYNPQTGLWAAFDLQTRELVGAWRLDGAQFTSFLGNNNVW